MLIETNSCALLIDPMLCDKATLPSYTKTKFNPQKNPIVNLPNGVENTLKKVTHCIITHLHSDHLDSKGEEYLKSNNIPVICSIKDEDELKRKGLNIYKTIEYWKKEKVLNFSIEGIPAKHGYGKVAELMGNVMGFYMAFDDFSIYLSSDTIYTNDVEKIFEEYKPEISVVACGTAQLDEYEPILMTKGDILKFIKKAPGQVIANHLEAVNHCTTSRSQLHNLLEKHGELFKKTWIPKDGESKRFY